MTKRHFIELADVMRCLNWTPEQLDAIIRFCKSQNAAFNTHRWLGYLRGECGPNGGNVR